MNQNNLVEIVHMKIGTTKTAAEEAVEAMIDAIISALKKGEDVSIAGLGKLKVKHVKARTARNPKTGATVHVPAKKKPAFTAAKALKEAVN